MVYCSNCGEKNEDSSQFCKNCGEALKNSNYSSKPIKSRIEALKEDSQLHDPKDIYYESQTYTEHEEETEDSIEWDVVVWGALILIILEGILIMILPQISLFIAIFMSLVYVLIYTRRKSTLVVVLPLTLLIAALIWAFFTP
ncbi:MAG: zinc ribbon domain-containing protein [Euryarchaeota archaeon]|nr:zinc ribbon domain-containing protein [Euryarchaeota archaeon]MBV1730227.1 zinc ribbon domain-containing protein [Methanobacterium sp.]MBU4547975.1 zinc ribbon domain-containing protein [Euryarchaeota archaeon]MBU4608934.1 zinc ribbon domain-containing protein [Euryarchaeota archaeon]MBV1755432.1 zinc ribbon domain-containing protein [Methanobacterium sp.]